MKKIKTIVLSGFISGSLDATAAIVFFTKPHSQHNIGMLFRYIARGILGKGAYSPGLIYPLTGLILHYLIATLWATFYLVIFSAAFKSGFLWVKIIAFAALIWTVMNGFVMPVFGYTAHNEGWSIMRSFLILLFCVSLPIVLITEKRKL